MRAKQKMAAMLWPALSWSNAKARCSISSTKQSLTTSKKCNAGVEKNLKLWIKLKLLSYRPIKLFVAFAFTKSIWILNRRSNLNYLLSLLQKVKGRPKSYDCFVIFLVVNEANFSNNSFSLVGMILKNWALTIKSRANKIQKFLEQITDSDR